MSALKAEVESTKRSDMMRMDGWNDGYVEGCEESEKTIKDLKAEVERLEREISRGNTDREQGYR